MKRQSLGEREMFLFLSTERMTAGQQLKIKFVLESENNNRKHLLIIPGPRLKRKSVQVWPKPGIS